MIDKDVMPRTSRYWKLTKSDYVEALAKYYKKHGGTKALKKDIKKYFKK